MRIVSPAATGNGAYIVHKTLQAELQDYQVLDYHPYWTLFPWLLSVLPLEKADALHMPLDYACFFKKKDTPLIATLHNYVLDPFMRPYSSCLQNLHYRTDLAYFIKKSTDLADSIVSVSQFTADVFRKDTGCKKAIQVIPNGVNESFFRPLMKKPRLRFKVLFSGNLTRRKGAQWLSGIAALLPEGIEIIYTLGLNKQSPIRGASNLSNIGSIPFDQMPQLYQSVDMLLMPTVREGMSLAVLEAMACGLPVVASDCSSLPEVIDEGLGGFLCEIGNCRQFAEKIIQLADDAALRNQMAEYNRTRIEKSFRLQTMVQAYQEVFEQTLG